MSTATPLLSSTPPSSTARAQAGRGRRRSDAAVRGIVRRAAAGDHGAWNELVEEFGMLLWHVTRAYGLGEADMADVVQTTWLRLFEHVGRLRDPTRVGAWLVTTARRECVKLRHAGHPIPVGDDLPERTCDAPPAFWRLMVAERDQALGLALGELPARDQRLLRMLMSETAPSYAAISAALGMPCGSIGPSRARALERLRREAGRRGLSNADV